MNYPDLASKSLKVQLLTVGFIVGLIRDNYSNSEIMKHVSDVFHINISLKEITEVKETEETVNQLSSYPYYNLPK